MRTSINNRFGHRFTLAVIAVMVAAMMICVPVMPLTDAARAAEDGEAAGGDAAGAVSEMTVMPESKELELAEDTAVTVDFGDEPDYKDYYYFKITPTKTGYISLTGSGMLGYVDLCNSAKKVISKESKDDSAFFSGASKHVYQRTVSFGVKKGVTYMMRINVYSLKRNDSGHYYASMKWTNTPVNGIRYGSSRSSAANLKKALARGGVIRAGSTKAQWYKIKTSKKKIAITLGAKNNCGTIYARIYYKSGGTWHSKRIQVMRSTKKYKKTVTLKKRTHKKVTYYVQVYPKYKASGAYKIVWK